MWPEFINQNVANDSVHHITYISVVTTSSYASRRDDCQITYLFIILYFILFLVVIPWDNIFSNSQILTVPRVRNYHYRALHVTARFVTRFNLWLRHDLWPHNASICDPARFVTKSASICDQRYTMILESKLCRGKLVFVFTLIMYTK